jgi:hypothetical protein
LECGALAPLSRRQLAAGDRGKPRLTKRRQPPHSKALGINLRR